MKDLPAYTTVRLMYSLAAVPALSITSPPALASAPWLAAFLRSDRARLCRTKSRFARRRRLTPFFGRHRRDRYDRFFHQRAQYGASSRATRLQEEPRTRSRCESGVRRFHARIRRRLAGRRRAPRRVATSHPRCSRARIEGKRLRRPGLWHSPQRQRARGLCHL